MNCFQIFAMSLCLGGLVGSGITIAALQSTLDREVAWRQRAHSAESRLKECEFDLEAKAACDVPIRCGKH